MAQPDKVFIKVDEPVDIEAIAAELMAALFGLSPATRAGQGHSSHQSGVPCSDV